MKIHNLAYSFCSPFRYHKWSTLSLVIVGYYYFQYGININCILWYNFLCLHPISLSLYIISINMYTKFTLIRSICLHQSYLRTFQLRANSSPWTLKQAGMLALSGHGCSWASITSSIRHISREANAVNNYSFIFAWPCIWS